MVFCSSLRFSFLALLQIVSLAVAFDNTRYDNVAVYWGQNSYGATHSDVVNFQQPINFYCNDNAIDVFPVAFVNTFFGTGGLPVMNLANTCNNVDNATFPGSELPNCQVLATDIQACQAKGKVVTISLGGAGGGVGFNSDAQAQSFADQIWNLFLGGSSSTRPFGSAVLDGVDLDIEGGSNSGYAAFVTQLRTHFNGASKKYYITGAPQCPYPDASLGAVLNAASFDAVYVQFYNNQCGLQNYNTSSDWDFGLWDNWARTVSPNPNVKVYIGAPASSTAAGGGYQPPQTLASIATQMRKSFPSFGGIMLWDASQAYANSRYDLAMKNALVAAGGTGFTFPACTAPTYVSGTSYTGGSQVSFGGYMWQAKWFADMTPANDPSNDWSSITACGGTGTAPAPPSSSSSIPSTTTNPSTTSKSSTSSAPTSTSNPPPASGKCAGVAAWSSSVAYPGGSMVVSGGHLWTANWWSQSDIPGGASGDWADDGACTTSAVVSVNVAPAVATGQPEASVKVSGSPAVSAAPAASAKVSDASPAEATGVPSRRSRVFRV
ncbi:carbohydrate-binding module family 5 protein [Sphaerobolus stellatus SS14]|nr:carbohydrate-binding module family 5 protein [Sphaerobolus stellatus SS14]